ncbi:hypothetical protein LGT39_08275 [Demequina sp. TTPB684]|uniref:hypothetical protein n=1 Tax=unclassified Demequina TaxID=2620311 RepID=UPI001CF5A8F2|nr:MULTISPECIES: hypothetical protein [unclassified Demequina]MCB2412840.1 hypothetical protein [Demequina sp. TTPB684]UPU87529.1 hypothetical protein LGT36_009690 [Demequina sp. TMPB413]
MNINDEMRELATQGGLAYAPSDDMIADLLGRTRRARSTRQSVATIATTVGAMALGLGAAQAYSAAKDDPAFRDRNIINNKDGLTPIELYRAKFGADNPTRNYDSQVDLSSIIDKLKTAAQTDPNPPNVKTVIPASGGTSGSGKTSGSTGSTAKDPYAECKADHPDKPYKYFDCAKQQWIIKDGWYKDPANSTYYECANQPAYVGYTYNCSTGSYAPKSGYFLFGNGAVYKAITWTDAATGASSLGNWSGSGNWGGWDNKAILVSSGSSTYSEYKYMAGDATWSGSTCTGKTASKYGATLQLSCLPTWKVESLGLNNGSPKISNDWILRDTHLKWFDPDCRYADPLNPPEGWTWTGSAWTETPVTPSP